MVTYRRGDGPHGVVAHVRVSSVRAQSGEARQGKAASGGAEPDESLRGVSRPLGVSGAFDDGSGLVRVDLSAVGNHNLLNATAARVAGVESGAGREEMVSAFSHFLGIGRRFELQEEVGGVRVISDHVHHPTKVRAAFRAVRAVVGDGVLRTLFQPYLYSRTANFAGWFAEALSLADDVVIISAYTAREDPAPGVEGDLITSKMDPIRAQFVPDGFEAIHTLAACAHPGDLVMAMGTGDVAELGPTILDQTEQR